MWKKELEAQKAAKAKKDAMWKKAYALAEKQLAEEAEAACKASSNWPPRAEQIPMRLWASLGSILLFGALTTLADDDGIVRDQLAAKRGASNAAAEAKAAQARLKRRGSSADGRGRAQGQYGAADPAALRQARKLSRPSPWQRQR